MSPKLPKAVAERPGERPAEAIRAHLIEATEALLADHPPLAITTRDIARAAGVSDGVLYNHFDDKDELIIAALMKRHERLAARFEAAMPTPGRNALADNLAALGEAAIALHAEMLPLVASLVTAPQFLHRLFRHLHGEAGDLPMGPRRVVDYLAAEQRLGRIAAEVDPAAAARLLLGGMLNLTLADHLSGHGRAPPIDRDFGQTIAILVRALEPRT